MANKKLFLFPIFQTVTITWLIQVPLWTSFLLIVLLSYKTVKLYLQLIEDAAPGYLYHSYIWQEL